MTSQQKRNNNNNIVNRVRVVGVPARDKQQPENHSSGGGLKSARANPSAVELLMQNYLNFNRSAAPARFMYYESDGSWVDFSAEVFESLKLCFLDGKPVVEVKVGENACMFDFYRMLMIEFETGDQRSIAWIDVEGKCFFPNIFVCGAGGKEFNFLGEQICVEENGGVEIARVSEDLSAEKPKIEIEIRIDSDLIGKRKRECMESHNESEGVSQEKTDGSCSSNNGGGGEKRQVIVPNLVSPKWPKVKFLKEGERAFAFVKNLFLSGLGNVEPGAKITSIHQCVRTDPLDKARYEVFQKQMLIIKAARGDSNMALAWHETSAKGVASISAHGFGMPTKITGSEAHGVGIYLSPVPSPHSGAMLSEIDDNGEKHVILCRVILGKCEKIEAGSQQLYPSAVDFDTGVDDINNPKWYVVWGANMNTHILPECIVSYKPPERMPGRNVFSKLGSSLPPPKAQEFPSLCKREMAKHAFLMQLKSVVGDAVLRSALREVRG